MKSENLNFLKFIAALLVIISHAYPLTGAGKSDMVYYFSKSAFTLGAFAVAIFFFSSGYFVTKSIIRKEGKGFWKGRIVRIYPPLITVILVSIFVLGPIVTTLPLKDYFLNATTYKYLLYLVMFPVYYLPGVFESNPFKGCVNGALWTIILEMICYLALWLMFKLGVFKNKKLFKVLSILFVLSMLVLFCGKIEIIVKYSGYLRPACIFVIGAIYAIYSDEIKPVLMLFLIAIAAWIILVITGFGNIAMILVFPYILYCVIFAKYQVPDFLSKTGEISYSVYLVGFPIQQLMYQIGVGRSVITNVASSIIVSIVVGFALYLTVERPTLKKIKL